MTAPKSLTIPNRLYRARVPIGLPHILAAFAGWLVIAVLCRIALPAIGEMGREFVASLFAVTLLFSAPGGLRGWLAALGAALTVAAMATAGILFTQWAGVRLEIDNEGLWNLIHIPVAVPSIALAIGLVRMLNRRFGAQDEQPGNVEDGEEAMTTGVAAVGCTTIFRIAGLFGLLVAFTATLFGQFRQTFLALAGYDVASIDGKPLEGMMVMVTGIWLFAHWDNRAARYATVGVLLAMLSLSIWIPVLEPWLAAWLAPDPDTFLNRLVRAAPGILFMALWLAALYLVGWKYDIINDGDDTATEELAENQETGA